ncbi:MAG: PRC-barrel domain-containing protein [Desulfomonilaceae bacterium]
MRIASSIIIGTATVLLMASCAFSPNQAFAFRDGQTSMRASERVAGVVIGKPVRNQRGVVLGTVENIVLNNSGCAQYVIISGRFRGARGRLYPVPWNVITRTAPEAIFVDFGPDFLVKAPYFEANRWPDLLGSQWGTRIHSFFAKASEEKTKSETGGKSTGRKWKTPAAHGKVSPQENLKHGTNFEKGRKLTPSEMSNQGVSKHKEMNIKSNKGVEGNKGTLKPGSSEMMMQRGRQGMEHKMMEHSQPGMQQKMMEHKNLGKQTPNQPGATVNPGAKEQKIQ